MKLYNENSITTWRNNTIGHGVLKFDDDEEFRNDIENKLLLIKKYLTFTFIKINTHLIQTSYFVYIPIINKFLYIVKYIK